MKDRADKIVFAQGFAESRHKAQALIMAGLVYAEGKRIEKAGQLLDADLHIELKETLPFVGRGGLKLDEALDVFKLSVNEKIAADMGASTGGFTDCLLQRGARRVYAVDVDTRQLDVKLRQDLRVVQIEKNARYLQKGDIPDPLDLVSIDLSFISVAKVLPAISEILTEGVVVCLIKPQFEVGRRQVGKKGIVRDLSLHEEVLLKLSVRAESLSFKTMAVMKPTVRGQKGNQEYFIHWRKEKMAAGGFSDNGQPTSLLEPIIKEVVRNEKN